MKYSEIIEDHFARPRNVGELRGATAVGEATNAVCLDKLRLWLRLENDVVAEVRFQAEGCVPSIAVASFLTEWLVGRTAPELRATTAEDVEAAVGGLPRTKAHAAHLAIEAIQHAFKNI
ncbi:MAG: iron-sulfur cluster assembly scaffold protein [Candidatus Sumerlaeaceae bacterium]